MKVLLDTHVWLWMMSTPERLNKTARAVLEDASVELSLSVASAWEVGIKHARGKLPLPCPVTKLVTDSVERFGMKVLPIHLHHALAAAALPSHHSDPFDRLLVAQATLEEMRLATADQLVSQYGDVLWVG
jgi:PIN domain nuclease of toxin-antitoxin system